MNYQAALFPGLVDCRPRMDESGSFRLELGVIPPIPIPFATLCCRMAPKRWAKDN